MTRLTLTLTALAGMAGGLVAVPAPALAQAGHGTIDIYGSDPCPVQNICIRHKETDRYRLPKSQNPQGTRQQKESWARRSQALTTAGNTGPQSCSPVGPGGFTGCLTQEINQAKQDRREQQEQDTPPEK